MQRSLFSFAAAAALAVLLGNSSTCAGSVASPYQIATWPGFRPGAVSYTFDDDLPNQYAEAVPMFHEAGLKMTLFTVINWETNWAAVQKAALWGDEIASHTVSHPQLPQVSAAQLTNELGTSQSIIDSYVTKVTNVSCVTLAYPFCSAPDEGVTAQYYFAARGCSGQIVPATPPDFLNISSFVVGNTGPYTTGESLNKLADRAVAANGWCVYLIHAIDGDKGYSPLAGAALQESVNYMKAHPDKFWVETFANVARYIKERDATSITEISHTDNSITFQVTNNLPMAIYNYPLTMRRLMPAGWQGAVLITQNKQPVLTKTTKSGSDTYVLFDVLPNGGEVSMADGRAKKE